MEEKQKKNRNVTGKLPVKIITVAHYGGTKKMSEVFENIITENIRKNLEKIS